MSAEERKKSGKRTVLSPEETRVCSRKPSVPHLNQGEEADVQRRPRPGTNMATMAVATVT